MSTVVVNVSTVDKAVDSGTQDEQFLFTVAPADPTIPSAPMQQKQSTPSATFPDVPAGDWIATVSKLGVESSASFTITADSSNTFQVPDAVTVTVS